jgi:hypothetical protein
MLKLLEPTDYQLLKDFIQEIKSTNPSIKESTSVALDWYFNKLVQVNSGCNIFVELENAKIVKAFFTMTVSSIFNSTAKIYPFWISGLIYALKHESTPSDGFSNLYDAAVAYYESIEYTTFFNVIKIPKNYTKAQIDKYMIGKYEKIVGKAVRYDYLIEAVIDNPDTYNGFKLFKLIIPQQIPINKKILITRMDLKNEFRNYGK